ncbi:MAG: hypothetical protein H6R15_1294 [Proteobacteria bacterium]|nr:hypothetical protein [Pseudomonadota bacterium]
MPIPWLSVLQSVPWSEVLSNAPKVADGAKKLWKSVARRAARTAPGETADGTLEAPSIASLDGRLAAVENTIEDLQGQLLATSELLKTLADQNARLVAQAEAVRRQLRRQVMAIVILAGGLVGSLWFGLGR